MNEADGEELIDFLEKHTQYYKSSLVKKLIKDREMLYETLSDIDCMSTDRAELESHAYAHFALNRSDKLWEIK